MKELSIVLNNCLELKRHIIGVRFVEDEEEYKKSRAMAPKNPMNYCGMVKSASVGHSLKSDEGLMKCKSAVKTLGINSEDVVNSKGENWTRLGIYKDQDVSQDVRSTLTYRQVPTYGVIVKPLEEYTEDEPNPHVVLVIGNPYNVMRLTQGYAYHYGMPQNINFIGNQGICLESTARPYEMDDINMSMLCIGTRHRAGWQEDEMSVGIPITKLENIVDGILKTIDQMESNEKKKKIEEKFKSSESDIDIRYDYNYYKDC
ncbi:MAG: DUF169 domain-containing protein [Clostridioides sp.]|jgi:uncharacterized protein (DUF169 family)|nr:DUF169 domain-containing protein [Clostridioides sp.]